MVVEEVPDRDLDLTPTPSGAVSDLAASTMHRGDLLLILGALTVYRPPSDRAMSVERGVSGPAMDALMFDGPAADASRTRVGTMLVPTPGPAEVLIRVTHAGINFKDVMMRRGDAGYVPAWPVVPGLEASGQITAVGSEVQDLVPGMRVAALTNSGGLAQYVVARAALTTRVPDAVSTEIAAVVPGVWSTAWLLLHEAARARADDTILVHSTSGGVGAAVAALAAAMPDVSLVGVVGSRGLFRHRLAWSATERGRLR